MFTASRCFAHHLRFVPHLLAVLLFSLSWSGSALARLNVVATTPDLASLAREVGGDAARVQALALPTQDPHFVDPRPHLMLALKDADLLLAVGLSLESGWLPTLQTGSRNLGIQRGARGYLECAEFVQLLEVAQTKVERSQGDVHPGGNPHYLFDPEAAARVAWGIAKRMAELDPEHAASYRARAQHFVSAAAAAVQRHRTRLVKLRGQSVVAYHRSLPYLARWLGLKVVVHIEPRPGIPPNPRHVLHVIEVAKAADVKLVLQEAWYPDKSSGLLASKIGARVVRLASGPDFRAGETYLAYIERLVKQLAEASK